jgi:hypothetical protein
VSQALRRAPLPISFNNSRRWNVYDNRLNTMTMHISNTCLKVILTRRWRSKTFPFTYIKYVQNWVQLHHSKYTFILYWISLLCHCVANLVSVSCGDTMWVSVPRVAGHDRERARPQPHWRMGRSWVMTVSTVSYVSVVSVFSVIHMDRVSFVRFAIDESDGYRSRQTQYAYHWTKASGGILRVVVNM